MTSTKKERNVVVIELQGGNDALNTVIPYNNPLYYDFRSNVGIPEGEVLHLDGEVGFNPNLAPRQAPVGPGQLRCHQRHRLSQPQPLALPLPGRVVHRRVGEDRRRGLAGRRHPRPGRQGRERPLPA